MSTLEYSHNTLNKTTFKKKSFSCGICSKDFTRNSSLQTHMNIHLNVKPYVCSICNFRFNANPNLIRHKKNVHNIRFYNGSKESTSKPSSPSQSESERSQTPPPPKKTSISLSDPIYNTDKNMKLTTYVDQQRKLPEPVYNVRIAHPVKFSDLVLYETVINHIESRR